MVGVVGAVAGSMGAVWLAWNPEEQTMAWVQTALLLAIFIAFIGYKSWRFRKWVALCGQGAALLDAGDLGAAQRALEDADGYALRPPERVLTRFQLGLCALFQGRVDAARAAFLALSRGWRTKEMPDVYVAAPDMLAACLALQGDLVEARHWLEEAHRRRRPGVVNLSLGEVLILCREERYGATVRLLDDRREFVEKSTVLYRKLLRVIRAFAWDALTTEEGANQGEEPKDLEPFRPGEFNSLGGQWPRMEAFLRARGLTDREAA
ncbi:tetratricopeptide repeat protein [Myxococcus sp. AM011]|nr:tetratricopeptide repeat protein [Myxococcus sp. AM011]